VSTQQAQAASNERARAAGTISIAGKGDDGAVDSA
jgi:hypothetical protein